MALAGQIALVTGASRGCGRGIARQLGKAKATVYITALKPEDEDPVVKSVAQKLPTLDQVAKEVQERGGKAIPVFCDHSKPTQVADLFKQIASEQNNRLDLLVNNAFSAVTAMMKAYASQAKFWDLPEEFYDVVNDCGLRGQYMTCRQAVKLMIPHRKGLIVTTSSPGGLSYLFSTAYGINKVGQDRLASDMAMELREHNVASVCLWPGAVKTELFVDCGLVKRDALKDLLETGESIDFAGKAVVALASDPKVMDKTGRILANMELAKEYGFAEDDGTHPFCPITRKNLPFLHQLNDLRQSAFLPKS